MAADPLVPVKTPFNYNLGINYETFVNGRNGRSITADLNEITKNFGLIKTFHDVANPGGANPLIDPDQLQVIKYVARSENLQLVMGTYTSALAKGGYGQAWSGPGSMTSAAYTDKWVQMLVKSFGSTKAVKDHLQMIVLGNEVDQADNHPPNVTQYMGWFRSAFDNLSASLKKAGLGSIPVTTTIAAYTRTDAGRPIAVGATQHIYQHWSSAWNGGKPVVLFNDYTPSNEHGPFASPEFKPVIDYYKTLYTKLGKKLAPFVGETGYSSFYTLENEIRVYNQIKSWLNGQYNNNARKTIPLFIFNAFDQPSKGGVEQQWGIYAEKPDTHRPTGLKPGLTLPTWSRSQIRPTSTNDMLHGSSRSDVMNGGAGRDGLYGAAGADKLYGAAGNDRLNGGTGADLMAGGAGNDTYYVDNAGDITRESVGQGGDKVFSSVSYSLAGQHIENLTLTGTGNLNAAGNSLNNVLTGNSGNNVLNGNAGADVMAGGLGHDTYHVDNTGDSARENAGQGFDQVFASVGYSLASQYVENLTLTGDANLNAAGNSLDNVLTGNSGNNILNGNAGADVMTGGDGSDTFVFVSDLVAGNFDTITDFSTAADTIRLNHAIFNTIVGTGTLSAAQFAANASGTAQDANDRIIYETDTGKLFFDSNGSAAGGAVQFAKLSPGLALAANDFSIV